MQVVCRRLKYLRGLAHPPMTRLALLCDEKKNIPELKLTLTNTLWLPAWTLFDLVMLYKAVSVWCDLAM